MFKTVFGALLLLLSVAAAQSDGGVKSDLLITLERTECLGSCPVYKVTILGDGSVVYEGHQFVRVKGTRRATVDPEKVLALVQSFTDAGYFDLADHYRSIKNPDGTETVVTDLATTYTSINLNGRHKAVEDYVGGPEKLQELERKIDETANSKHYVDIDAPAVHEEVKRGWNINGKDAQELFLDAARRGDADTVRAFIEEGVNAKGTGKVQAIQQARGVVTVKMLIAAGADVNATSREYFGPPLSFASALGDVESMRVLIDSGAKVDGRSPRGETPLMSAAAHGEVEAVRLLLKTGADVHARDNFGTDALRCAQTWFDQQEELTKEPAPFDKGDPAYRAKYQEIRSLLLAAGAEEK